MGMFDNIACKMPLPGLPLTWVPNFQTKSLGCEMDNYEIREDGTLWKENFDIEDRSDSTKEGIKRFAGMMTRVNKRMVFWPYNGEICFYDCGKNGEWYKYNAILIDGKCLRIDVVEQRPAWAEGCK
jgi:hypothetical protein